MYTDFNETLRIPTAMSESPKKATKRAPRGLEPSSCRVYNHRGTDVPSYDQLRSIKDAKTSVRCVNIDKIRQKDSIWTPTQGPLLKEWLEAEHKQLLKLVPFFSNCGQHISIRRGGPLLARKLNALTEIPHNKLIEIDKCPHGSSEQSKIPRAFQDDVKRLAHQLTQENYGNRQICITESFIGGGSVNNLTAWLDTIAKEYPKVTFVILAEHQLLQSEEYSQEACLSDVYDRHPRIKTPKSKNIKLYMVNVPYISGEDVDYQCNPLSSHHYKPVLLCHPKVTLAIDPGSRQTSMDVVVELVANGNNLDQYRSLEKESDPREGASAKMATRKPKKTKGRDKRSKTQPNSAAGSANSLRPSSTKSSRSKKKGKGRTKEG